MLCSWMQKPKRGEFPIQLVRNSIQAHRAQSARGRVIFIFAYGYGVKVLLVEIMTIFQVMHYSAANGGGWIKCASLARSISETRRRSSRSNPKSNSASAKWYCHYSLAARRLPASHWRKRRDAVWAAHRFAFRWGRIRVQIQRQQRRRHVRIKLLVLSFRFAGLTSRTANSLIASPLSAAL